MPLTIEQIQAILKLVDESGCEEFRLETPDVKLHVRKSGATTTPADVPRMALAPVEPAVRPETPRGSAGPAVESVPDGLVAVRAPMTGTFYRAPAPGAPPFVEVGSRVKADDTVCILEVMKLMNSIPAGASGRVVRICTENAALVAHDQVLVLIEPESTGG